MLAGRVATQRRKKPQNNNKLVCGSDGNGTLVTMGCSKQMKEAAVL